MGRVYRFLAFRLPKGLVYWSAVRVFGMATTGKYSDQIVPELTMMDALIRWDIAVTHK